MSMKKTTEADYFSIPPVVRSKTTSEILYFAYNFCHIESIFRFYNSK